MENGKLENVNTGLDPSQNEMVQKSTLITAQTSVASAVFSGKEEK